MKSLSQNPVGASRIVVSQVGRRLQRGAKSLVGRMASKSLMSFVAQGFFSGASFATSVIIGRNASKEVLGAYYLGLTLILILRALQAELVTAPFTVFGQGRSRDDLAGYTGSIAFFQSVLVAASIPLFLIAAGVAQWGVASANLRPVFWILAAFAPFLLLREFIRQFSFARMRTETVVIVDVAVGVLQVAGLFWLVTHRDIVAHEVYVVIGLANLAACVGWLVFGHKGIRLDATRFRGDWSLNWSFAKWALASQLICSCTPFVLPWFLVFVHGEAEAGVSAACSSLIGLAFVFTIAVSNLLTPKSAHAYATEGVAGLRRVLGKALAVFTVGIGLFCGAVFLFIDDVLPFIYGPQYGAYGMVCFVFALALLFNSLSIVGGNGLWAMRMPRANLPGDIATLLATVAAGVVFIQPLGALGGALASLAGAFAGSLVRGCRLWKEMKLAEEGEQAGSAHPERDVAAAAT